MKGIPMKEKMAGVGRISLWRGDDWVGVQE